MTWTEAFENLEAGNAVQHPKLSRPLILVAGQFYLYNPPMSLWYPRPVDFKATTWQVVKTVEDRR